MDDTSDEVMAACQKLVYIHACTIRMYVVLSHSSLLPPSVRLQKRLKFWACDGGRSRTQKLNYFWTTGSILLTQILSCLTNSASR